MQLLKKINPAKVDENNLPDWQYRTAARAVVFDKENRVGLLFVSKKNYYKLPGGGVEKGEAIKTALDRECKEELGVKVEVLDEIGMIIEYRSKFKLHQTSYCYIAKVTSEKNEPKFTDTEKSNGFRVVWTEPTKALQLLSLHQTDDYEGHLIEERDFCFLTRALQKIN